MIDERYGREKNRLNYSELSNKSVQVFANVCARSGLAFIEILWIFCEALFSLKLPKLEPILEFGL